MADIPDDVRRFVTANIPSVPYLEALLIFQADPARPLDAAQLARALYVSTAQAEELLAALCAAGVVQPVRASPAGYRYAPGDEAVAEVIGRLARVYPKNLIDITHMIHGAAGANARRFADVFKIRKDR